MGYYMKIPVELIACPYFNYAERAVLSILLSPIQDGSFDTQGPTSFDLDEFERRLRVPKKYIESTLIKGENLGFIVTSKHGFRPCLPSFWKEIAKLYWTANLAEPDSFGGFDPAEQEQIKWAEGVNAYLDAVFNIADEGRINLTYIQKRAALNLPLLKPVLLDSVYNNWAQTMSRDLPEGVPTWEEFVGGDAPKKTNMSADEILELHEEYMELYGE